MTGSTAPGPRPQPRRSRACARWIGAAVTAAVDEINFHQISWHHFYDRSTSSGGLLFDGMLQSAESLAPVAGFFLHAGCAPPPGPGPGPRPRGRSTSPHHFSVFSSVAVGCHGKHAQAPESGGETDSIGVLVVLSRVARSGRNLPWLPHPLGRPAMLSPSLTGCSTSLAACGRSSTYAASNGYSARRPTDGCRRQWAEC
ncbi:MULTISPECIES: DUF2243 domain-containing protein [unclassified Streptomyces]|uniref:DUF2243 domain-containing protein n=1 Tax=unclassified Streptomyces TaxID=2593676 RepID=UPI0027E24EAA|nr:MULTISPECIES: DUF2243 domain-containing protein [unclassified Streptomyces]